MMTEQTRRRRALIWVNVVLTSGLLAGVLVLLNLVSERIYARMDLTHSRRYDLTDHTRRVLAQLDRDVNIYVMPPWWDAAFNDERLPRVRQRLWDLLREYAQRSEHIRVVQLDEADAERRAALQEIFEVVQPYDAVYLWAEGSGGERRKQGFPLSQLFMARPGRGHVFTFMAEEILTNSIRSVTLEKGRTAYVVAGHREDNPADIANPDAHGVAINLFRTREGVEVKPLILLAEDRVPPDCDLLFIVGAKQPFDELEVDKVRDYLEGGGNLFYAPVAGRRTGLEPLLEAWGAVVGKFVVLEVRGGRATKPIVTTFSDHPVNRGLQGRGFPMLWSSVVDPSAGTDNRVQAGTIMWSAKMSWEERQPFDPKEPPKVDPDERKGPLSLAVAITAQVDHPVDGGKDHARIIVWGSRQALSNQNLLFGPGAYHLDRVEYIMNNFRWLIGNEDLISIPPVRDEMEPWRPTESARSFLWIIVPLGPVVLGVGMGFFVWRRRRS